MQLGRVQHSGKAKCLNSILEPCQIGFKALGRPALGLIQPLRSLSRRKTAPLELRRGTWVISNVLREATTPPIEQASREPALTTENSASSSSGSRNTTTNRSAPSTAAAAAAATGTLFSAVALITGSTVGAGMLALPAVTAPAGFTPTAVGLGATWLLLTFQALLMAEVNLTLMERQQNQNKIIYGANSEIATAPPKLVTLRQMAERTLGAPGKAVTVIYLALSYGLLVAYLSKAAEVIDFFAGHGLPPSLAAAGFVGAAGALFLTGGPAAADRLNQALTSALLLLFCGIVAAGFSQHDVPAALAAQPAVWSAMAPSIPIIFLSLVYHDLVPLICSMLGGDRKNIQTALVLGSLVPLGMFISWEAVALSLLPGGIASGGVGDATTMLQVSLSTAGTAAAAAGTAVSASSTSVAADIADAVGPALAVDPLQLFVRKSGPLVGSVVQGFAFMAVLTSFLGTTLGLSETLYSEVPPLVREAGRLLGIQAMETYDGDSCIGSFADEDDPTSRRSGSGITGGIRTDATTPMSCGDGDGNGQLNSGRALALGLSLLPPLAFTAENPGAFLAVLSVAGGAGMTLLYGIMPPLMAWKLRAEASKGDSSISQVQEMVPGGTPMLACLLTAAIGVGLSRVVADGGAAVQTNAAAVAETVSASAAALHATLLNL